MSRFGSVAIWILRFLLAVFFAIQGFVKLSGSPAWVSRFRGWGYPDHFYLAVGIAELAGAVALVVPMTTRFGAAVLILVMAGATATHAVHRESQLITTLILIACLAIVLYSPSHGHPENRFIVDPQ